jgi:heterodisulfide reductase subunit A
MHQPVEATRKAKRLVRAAVAKARTLQPLARSRTEARKAALVIGGGISGMTAALEVASQGIPVTLLEREAELGGFMRRMGRTLEGEDIPARLRDIEKRLRGNGLVKVILGARLRKVEGYVGKYRSVVET